MSEYEDSYRRATQAVNTAVKNGHIILPETDDPEQQIIDVAEFFMVALGVNPD